MLNQSSIEFLTTYSFMFLVLSITLGLIIVASVSQQDVVTSSCTPFGGLGCSFVYLYSNSLGSYSELDLALANSQSIPLNITNATLQISGVNYNGGCSPTMALSGQNIECKFYIPFSVQQYNLVRGDYVINATYCASGFYQTSNSFSCQGDIVYYTGSLIAQALPYDVSNFGVDAGIVVPESVVSLPTSSNAPMFYINGNFLILQSGEWTGGAYGYSFGAAPYRGNIYVGQKTVAFPNDTSILNGNVACALPYNTTEALVYSTWYSKGSSTITMRLSFGANSLINAYYKKATSNTWTQYALGGYSGSGSETSSITVTPNDYYDIAVVWENYCGSGYQSFNLTGAI